jgi:photosystem II stability/assembly factor-like uncharacterized protein
LISTTSKAQKANGFVYDVHNQTIQEIEKLGHAYLDSLKMVMTKPNADIVQIQQELRYVKAQLSTLRTNAGEDDKVRTINVQNMYEKEKERSQKLAQNMNIGNWYHITTNTSNSNPSVIEWFSKTSKIIIDPNDVNVLYTLNGHYGNAIFKSKDKGLTWECISNGFGTRHQVFCIDYNNSNHLLATSADHIITSYDGGNNWLNTNFSYDISSTFLDQISQSKSNSNTFLCLKNGGIYKSIDGGVNWELKRQFQSNYVSLSTIAHMASSSKCFIAATDSLMKSNNDGSTWSLIPSSAFIPALPAINIYEFGGDNFYTNSASSNIIYYTRIDPQYRVHVYKSMNAGTSFNRVSIINPFNITYNYQLAISPTDANNIFFFSDSSFKSTDGGLTWSTIPFGHESIIDVLFLDSNEFFVGLPYGLHHTINQFATIQNIGLRFQSNTYSKLSSLENNGNYFLVDNSNNDYIGCKLVESGNEKSLAAQNIELNHPTNGDIFYVNSGGYILKTTNKGLSFDSAFVAPGKMLLNPQNPNTFLSIKKSFNNYDTLLVSYDAGVNWSSKAVFNQWENVLDVQISSNDTSRFYSVIFNSGIALVKGSSSGGNAGTWTNIVEGDKFRLLSLNNSNKNEFYGFLNDSLYQFSWTGLGTASATFLYKLPNDIYPLSMAYQSAGHKGLYIGTNIGIYFFSLTNNSAILLSNGLPLGAVNDIFLHEPLGLISIALYGRGIWQGPLYDACSANYTHQDGLFQPPVYGTEYFEVSNQIISTKLIQGGIGTNVIYNAGNNVTMNVGFEVKAGSEMRAYIDGCTLPAPAPRISLPGQITGEATANLESNSAYVKQYMELDQNEVMYPNPASDFVAFEYTLQNASSVSISICDMSGRVQAVWLNESNVPEGKHLHQFNITQLKGGTYMVYVTINGNKQVHKLVVIDK